MAQTIRRIISGLLVAFALIAFWGTPDWLPFDLDGALNAAISTDVWIVNHAALPGFFILFAAIGLVLVVPDLWRGAAWTAAKIAGKGPLTTLFDQVLPVCREETLLSTGQYAVFFRLLVVNDTEILKRAVNARLAEVTRQSDNFRQITHVLLGWMTHSWPPITQFDIPAKGQEILDCFYITDNGEIWPPFHNWPNSFPADMFAEPGNYLFKILIDADEDDPIELRLRLQWTGDWKTASVASLWPRK